MVQMRVEHKMNSFDFTCRDDYPKDYVYVDEVYKYEKKNNIPLLMYVSESANRTHAIVIYSVSKDKWEKIIKMDKNQNRECESYVVNKKHVRFCKIDEVFFHSV